MSDNPAFVRALIEQVRLGHWTPEQGVTYLRAAELNADLETVREAVRLAGGIEVMLCRVRSGDVNYDWTAARQRRRLYEADLAACIDKLAQPAESVRLANGDGAS